MQGKRLKALYRKPQRDPRLNIKGFKKNKSNKSPKRKGKKRKNKSTKIDMSKKLKLRL